MKNVLTYMNWDDSVKEKLERELKEYLDVLKWAYREYQDNILYSCSFGAEGMVLIDLISKIEPHANIIFLDTELHFKETYELIEKVKQKYPSLNIKMVKPSLTLKEQAEKHGDMLWERNPNHCCQIRKIEPLTRELAGVEAWISGLRRDQSSTRSTVDYINKDEKFKKIKICPLIHWSWEDVWTYIQLNQLPYNELHDREYPSIGCEKCTLPASSTDLRSGRWANKDKTECGLHLNSQ